MLFEWSPSGTTFPGRLSQEVYSLKPLQFLLCLSKPTILFSFFSKKNAPPENRQMVKKTLWKVKAKTVVPHEAIRLVQCCKVSLVLFPPSLQLSPPLSIIRLRGDENILKAQFPSTHSSHFSLTQPTAPKEKKLLLFRLVPCQRKYKKYILSPIRKMARTQT